MVDASVRGSATDARVPGSATVSPARADAEPATAGSLGRRPSSMSIVVFLLIAAIFAGLSWFTYAQYHDNEKRLLRLQTRQTATLLQSFVQTLQTPLASAAEIAASNGGASAGYQAYASQFLRKQARFVSVTLWQVRGSAAPRLVHTTGEAPRLASSTARRNAFLTKVAHSNGVGVIGFLSGNARRVGYGVSSAPSGNRYVVYAEDRLRPRYRNTTAKTSPFVDLRYALYLGDKPTPTTLLATSERHLPLSGLTAQQVIPFGSSSLTLVASPAAPLEGHYADKRWWVVAILGLVVAIAGGFATDRLVKRRRTAEALARQNAELLLDQRTIAESLQRALMPGGMPSLPGLEVSARYFPGVNGIEIGGDWYDVIPVDDDHFFFVVGDVSGRGLEAGSVMASLHFAIRGFVAEGHDPATVLTLLTRVLDLDRDKHFATVVCGYADAARREVTIANAGHLPPLVVSERGSEYVTTKVGPPIGVRKAFPYGAVTIEMPANSTLLAFTDGLVERRGETLDVGLRRLQDAIPQASRGLDDMLTAILAELTPRGADDDTALLGFRWTESEPA